MEQVEQAYGKCLACKAPMSAEEQFCTSCGADRERELEIEAFQGPALASARKWILAVGILYAVNALIVWAVQGDYWTEEMMYIVLGTNFGLTAVHIGLWQWAKQSPFPAAVVALVLFVTLQLVNLVLDPGSAWKGIIIKVIFLVVLIKAVKAGLEAQKMRAQKAG